MEVADPGGLPILSFDRDPGPHDALADLHLRSPVSRSLGADIDDLPVSGNLHPAGEGVGHEGHGRILHLSPVGQERWLEAGAIDWTRTFPGCFVTFLNES